MTEFFKPEVRLVDKYRNNKVSVLIHSQFEPTSKARFFLTLIERWGMVACAPDGEDTSGRQKLKLMAPEDLINRAKEVADLAYTTIQQQNWYYETHTIDELLKETKD